MKKLFLPLLLVLISSYAIGQNHNVTITVNMANETVSPDGVFLAGGVDFGVPGDNPMTDNGDGTHTITVSVTDGYTGNYTFTNGACGDWGCKENIVGQDCADGQYDDRLLANVMSDTTITTCFSDCSEDGSCPGVVEPGDSVNVMITVNMENETVSADGVFLAGGNDFGVPGTNLMADNGDGTHSITVRVPHGYTGNYTFTNGACADWGCKENIVGQSCANGQYDDRLLANVMSDTTITTCFSSCSEDGTCPTIGDAVDVTFKIDMNDIADVTDVFMGGSYEGWQGSGTLTDDDTDGIWEVTISMDPGTYEYKFANASWETGQEIFDPSEDSLCTKTSGIYTNRIITIGDMNMTVDAVCFESCDACVMDGLNDVTFDNSFFSIQPSLALDYTTLVFNTTNNDDKAVTVLNAIGQVVYSTTLARDVATHKLAVNGFSNGLYFVQVQSGNTIGTHKMVVNK